MAEKKTKQEKAAEEYFGSFSKEKVHSSRKYKEDSVRPSKTSFKDKEIGINSYVILEESDGRDVSGYTLCKVVDFDDNEQYWSRKTDIFVVVVEVSKESMKGSVGRMRLASPDTWSFKPTRKIVAVGKEGWADYKVTE